MIKVLDHVRESLIRSQVDINDIQFGFYAWAQYYRCNISRPTNARKPVYQKEENLICFCWPRKDLWPGTLFCPLVGYEVIGNWWIVRLVNVMYDGANARVKVNGCFSETFEETVGVYQGSVLSQFLPLWWKLSLSQVSNWLPLGTPICKWSCYH